MSDRKTLVNILSENQLQALELLKERLSQKYDLDNIIVFGSTARGEAEETSDLDILIITKRQLSHQERHGVYEIATMINWDYDTNISTTIADKYNWDQGVYSIMLIKDEVLRDGVVV